MVGISEYKIEGTIKEPRSHLKTTLGNRLLLVLANLFQQLGAVFGVVDLVNAADGGAHSGLVIVIPQLRAQLEDERREGERLQALLELVAVALEHAVQLLQ